MHASLVWLDSTVRWPNLAPNGHRRVSKTGHIWDHSPAQEFGGKVNRQFLVFDSSRVRTTQASMTQDIVHWHFSTCQSDPTKRPANVVQN